MEIVAAHYTIVDPASDDVCHVDSILATLRQLDQLLSRGLVRFHERQVAREAAHHDDPYRSFYISPDEVVVLLTERPPDTSPPLEPLTIAPTSRLSRLGSRYGLDTIDLYLLLIALAPDLDLRYERIYGYLQDDATRKRPCVDFALSLLYPAPSERLLGRRWLAASASLIRHQLLRVREDPSDPVSSLGANYLQADKRIIAYLLGDDTIDQRLWPIATLLRPQTGLDALLLSPEIETRLVRLAAGLRRRTTACTCILRGPVGSGKQTIASALCADLGLGLLVVDAKQLPLEIPALVAMLRLALREADLQEAALYLQSVDTMLSDAQNPCRASLFAELAGWPGLSFLACVRDSELSELPQSLNLVQLQLALPAGSERIALWERLLANEGDTGSGVSRELAKRFQLSAGQIRDAALVARGLAQGRDGLDAVPDATDLATACRMQSSGRLDGLARKSLPRRSWEALILPPEQLGQLREICDIARYRSIVYEHWGFDRKLALGKGLNVLFAGPSGTGKTMAAELVAGQLGFDLYTVDLGAVVSKYIGETEKNLGRIFDEAERSNAVLFFDEADALFGKRSEVRDSHDRYANIETAYLLQRIEAYEGIVILATNLRKNMDEAFARRLQMTVEFPFPGPADRLRIWESIWPDKLPRAPDLDLAFLAQRFELSGGNIRNIALAAAFLAATNGTSLTMEHLVRATSRELQKIGTLLTGDEFGVYVSGV